MTRKCQTIYQRYRELARLTQEGAAELLGVSVRSLAAWETGERTPPDIRVADMCDLYGVPVLAIQHLRMNSILAQEALPPVDAVPLPQAVCRLLAAIRKLEEIHAGDSLLQIAADGRVDELERPEFDQLLLELEPIVGAVLELRCAREG